MAFHWRCRVHFTRLYYLVHDSFTFFIFLKEFSSFRHWWSGKSFRDTCRIAGIENFRFHDLRHDFCSRLVQRGADLYSVGALAGHKDSKTTQRYAHLSPETLRATIRILDSGYNLATMGNHQEVVTS